MARAVNDGLAAMAASAPDRLRWMASVPLQAPERAVAVLEDAVAAGAVGVEIGTSAAATRLDEPALEPFWAAAERLGLPVMLHPAYTTPHPGLGGLLPGERDRLPARDDDRDRAADLRRHARPPPGAARRAAARRRLLPLAGRAPAPRATVRPELADAPRDPWSYVGQVLLDTITHDAVALSYLVARSGAEHLVLGTDLPFDMATPDPMAMLRAACDEAEVRAIAEDNPARLYRFTNERKEAPCPT